jgi:hypothetical protein
MLTLSKHTHTFTNYHNVKSSISWDIMSCSPSKVDQHFGGQYRLFIQGRRISQTRNQSEINVALLATCFSLVSCFTYFSTLKTKAICSSETFVDFQRITRCYIPEDRTLHNHRCENQKSCYHVDLQADFTFLAVVLRSSFSLGTL